MRPHKIDTILWPSQAKFNIMILHRQPSQHHLIKFSLKMSCTSPKDRPDRKERHLHQRLLRAKLLRLKKEAAQSLEQRSQTSKDKPASRFKVSLCRYRILQRRPVLWRLPRDSNQPTHSFRVKHKSRRCSRGPIRIVCSSSRQQTSRPSKSSMIKSWLPTLFQNKIIRPNLSRSWIRKPMVKFRIPRKDFPER